MSLPPAQHHGVQAARDLDEPGPDCRMQRRQGMARHLAGDDPALLHERLAGEQAALAVLVIDERQPALIARYRLVAPAREIIVDDLAEGVRIAASGHAA